MQNALFQRRIEAPVKVLSGNLYVRFLAACSKQLFQAALTRRTRVFGCPQAYLLTSTTTSRTAALQVEICTTAITLRVDVGHPCGPRGGVRDTERCRPGASALGPAVRIFSRCIWHVSMSNAHKPQADNCFNCFPALGATSSIDTSKKEEGRETARVMPRSASLQPLKFRSGRPCKSHGSEAEKSRHTLPPVLASASRRRCQDEQRPSSASRVKKIFPETSVLLDMAMSAVSHR